MYCKYLLIKKILNKLNSVHLCATLFLKMCLLRQQHKKHNAMHLRQKKILWMVYVLVYICLCVTNNQTISLSNTFVGPRNSEYISQCVHRDHNASTQGSWGRRIKGYPGLHHEVKANLNYIVRLFQNNKR